MTKTTRLFIRDSRVSHLASQYPQPRLKTRLEKGSRGASPHYSDASPSVRFLSPVSLSNNKEMGIKAQCKPLVTGRQPLRFVVKCPPWLRTKSNKMCRRPRSFAAPYSFTLKIRLRISSTFQAELPHNAEKRKCALKDDTGVGKNALTSLTPHPPRFT